MNPGMHFLIYLRGSHCAEGASLTSVVTWMLSDVHSGQLKSVGYYIKQSSVISPQEPFSYLNSWGGAWVTDAAIPGPLVNSAIQKPAVSWLWVVRRNSLFQSQKFNNYTVFLKYFINISSVTQLCLTVCDPVDCSTPGFPVHHQLLELTQTHVHWAGDAIQLSHPLLSPSPTFSLAQYQGLFQWVSSSHQVAKGLMFQLQHQSFQWIFRTDLL